ncbi:type III secretion system HrpP C-terminal domain-containing protein [Winslowiella iniecta]|uniref:type III secretion system HrpP C-terminal domain-containing protein n=1 Tax=Winslowiella iniecta TaxID=1560201 RepID=UPI00069E747D|nr:type III secretion system HrpP C-terminal domain-containing protein [Winslowiella iniecta]
MTPLQQQAQRAAEKVQANQHQHRRQAEEPRQQQATRRLPSAAGQTEHAAKATDRPGRHQSESGDRTRRTPARERHSSAGESPALKRRVPNEPAQQEASLFSELLGGQSAPTLAMAGAGYDGSTGLYSPTARASESHAPAMAVWHQLEPSLSAELEKQPPGPVSMTLLLPKLGEVDARLSSLPTGAGWDISLRFAPQALAMIAPHHERCRESLRRRMACRIRLRFEQRGGC